MTLPISRRGFVAGALAGLGDFAFLRSLPTLSADEVKVKPDMVRLDSDIEPLVRLLEDTDRPRLLETIADRIHRGTSYQQLLSALMLAGVRGIRPHPLGFQFHAVLVVHSAHLATLAAEDRDRWLPLFWALDYFKVAQETNRNQGGWTMPPAEAIKLPAPHLAKARFIEAMDNWDVEAADAAVTALAQCAGADEIYELFFRYGARDFRAIGHKAIYVANSRRTLQTIGWRHAEPVLRSLALGLLEHEKDNPAKRDDPADRPGRDNLARVGKLGDQWQSGKPSSEIAVDLLATLRTATPADMGQQMFKLLEGGTHPSSLWEGLFLGAGELLMRQPGIVGIHCVTSINALHQAYQLSADPKTRQLMLLQGASFLTMFRGEMGKRGKLSETRLDALEPVEATGPAEETITTVFADAKGDRSLAARKALGLLTKDATAAGPLMAAARRLVFSKGKDAPRLQVQFRGPGRRLCVEPKVAAVLSGEQSVPVAFVGGSGQ